MEISALKRSFDLLSLVESDTRLKASGRYRMGPCPFCGGRDRFTLKQISDGWLWHCRGCGGEKYQDAPAYLMRREGLSFRAALEWMAGRPSKPRREQRGSHTQRRAFPSAEWQQKALAAVDRACSRLLSPQGARTRTVLRERGLSEPSWYQHLLGSTEMRGRPALVIPHFDNDWRVTALKYRFIDGKTPRYQAHRGSRLLFWGLHNDFPGRDTLLLVEGELNAVSICQCRPAGTTVISFASETLNQQQKNLLPVLARSYERVVVWCDRPEKVREIQAVLGGYCNWCRSPGGRDANDLLQAGLLSPFLERIEVGGKVHPT